MMNKKDRFKVIVGASILGICFSTYLLFQRRGGYLVNSDYFTLVFLAILLAIFLIYLKKKKF